jgi:hypothetical protein
MIGKELIDGVWYQTKLIIYSDGKRTKRYHRFTAFGVSMIPTFIKRM